MTKQILIPSLAITDHTVRKYVRELPRNGEVLVHNGESVSPNSVIAKTTIPGNLNIVRAAQELGVEPHEIAPLVKHKIGDIVKVGDILASYRGLFGFFSSECRSRYDGTIEFISTQTGNIGIRNPVTAVELKAHVQGRVISIIENRGASIEASGAFLQGVFGVGGERSGKLKALPVGSQEITRRSKIPDNIDGAILFGGASITIDGLTAAAERGAVGVITGSIDNDTLTAYIGREIGVAVTGDEKVPLTLIITEGFGALPMHNRALELLKKYEGSNASINGATQVRAGAVRPEIMIFHGIDQNTDMIKPVVLEAGASIRLVRHPYFGINGKIVSLPHKPQKLSTGAFARVLEVQLETGETVIIPRANAELL